MENIINWISNSSLTMVMQEKFWIVPFIQSIHICAIAALAAAALISQLRILGWMASDQSASDVMRRHLLWLWISLSVLLVSGILLIISEPQRAVTNFFFWTKMAMVLAAFIFSLLLVKPFLKSEDTIAQSECLVWAKPLAILSLLLWVAVIFAGRWIAYGG